MRQLLPTDSRGALRPAIAALALLLAHEHGSAQEVSEATAAERGTMTNWSSDVALEALSARGAEPVEANRVMLNLGGGPVIVQWSLSYHAYANSQGQRAGSVGVRPVAILEREGIEIARWSLGENQAEGPKDQAFQARVTGTASGLFVDRTPGSGRRTYILKVSNERSSRNSAVTVTTRTMICEER
jgi:hypothetical protein